MTRTPKTKLKQFTAYDLIEKAIEAVEKNVTTPSKFKSYFRVDFTFIQMCSYLKKKKIWGHYVLNDSELGVLKNSKNKAELLYTLKGIKNKNTRTIFDDFDV